MTDTPPESALVHLAQRREQIAAEQILDLPVPRWNNPVIVVKYRPVEHEEVRRVLRAAENPRPGQSKSDAILNANADVLIKACAGIEAHNPDETWDGFDDQLAESLGIETKTARAVCRALFITEGDLLMHAAKVGEFSGYVEKEIDEELEGE